MFGSVVEWFYSGLGGIKADLNSVGMKHFMIEPKLISDLSYCKSSYDSAFGKIRSEWKKSADGKIEVLIEVPQNTSATYVLPLNKQQIRDESGEHGSVAAVNGKYQLEFKSGVYRFEVL